MKSDKCDGLEYYRLHQTVVAVDTPEGWDAIQDKLEKWAYGNIMRFSKGKYKVLPLDWGNTWYQYRLRDEGIQGSPNKKGLAVLGMTNSPDTAKNPNLVEEVSKPLSIAYQPSGLSGEVPDDWKLAIVTPINKKVYKEDLGNYRPVSLTSVPGRVMEQFILSVITQHLQDG
ncbi:hypothetical protein WISP_144521 [Willisornis vidua]|uniref:Uncharacterized protein n=1 Tax=Willisornis vidua TaxID=1566151 RepID=A0ABQ9CL56_9PASS|nr:hypothetical protein WISP_144521 [Willisornis vidua]